MLKNMKWDKKLNIHTMGRDESTADMFHHPYEPTPYAVLERLADSGYIDNDSIVLDYGCGKGRVGFFLNHMLGCRTIGLEYDKKIYTHALQNQMNYGENDNITFLCQNAERYKIEDANCFYFFNPFTIEILRAVILGILISYYENPRTMRLFFYYPDDDYVAYLMSTDELQFLDEINCQDLFRGKNPRERILIFEIEE